MKKNIQEAGVFKGAKNINNDLVRLSNTELWNTGIADDMNSFSEIKGFDDLKKNVLNFNGDVRTYFNEVKKLIGICYRAQLKENDPTAKPAITIATQFAAIDMSKEYMVTKYSYEEGENCETTWSIQFDKGIGDLMSRIVFLKDTAVSRVDGGGIFEDEQWDLMYSAPDKRGNFKENTLISDLGRMLKYPSGGSIDSLVQQYNPARYRMAFEDNNMREHFSQQINDIIDFEDEGKNYKITLINNKDGYRNIAFSFLNVERDGMLDGSKGNYAPIKCFVDDYGKITDENGMTLIYSIDHIYGEHSNRGKNIKDNNAARFLRYVTKRANNSFAARHNYREYTINFNTQLIQQWLQSGNPEFQELANKYINGGVVLCLRYDDNEKTHIEVIDKATHDVITNHGEYEILTPVLKQGGMSDEYLKTIKPFNINQNSYTFYSPLVKMYRDGDGYEYESLQQAADSLGVKDGDDISGLNVVEILNVMKKSKVSDGDTLTFVNNTAYMSEKTLYIKDIVKNILTEKSAAFGSFLNQIGALNEGTSMMTFEDILKSLYTTFKDKPIRISTPSNTIIDIGIKEPKVNDRESYPDEVWYRGLYIAEDGSILMAKQVPLPKGGFFTTAYKVDNQVPLIIKGKIYDVEVSNYGRVAKYDAQYQYAFKGKKMNGKFNILSSGKFSSYPANDINAVVAKEVKGKLVEGDERTINMGLHKLVASTLHFDEYKTLRANYEQMLGPERFQVNGMLVHHKNGNTTDYSANNVAWVYTNENTLFDNGMGIGLFKHHGNNELPILAWATSSFKEVKKSITNRDINIEDETLQPILDRILKISTGGIDKRLRNSETISVDDQIDFGQPVYLLRRVYLQDARFNLMKPSEIATCVIGYNFTDSWGVDINGKVYVTENRAEAESQASKYNGTVLSPSQLVSMGYTELNTKVKAFDEPNLFLAQRAPKPGLQRMGQRMNEHREILNMMNKLGARIDTDRY